MAKLSIYQYFLAFTKEAIFTLTDRGAYKLITDGYSYVKTASRKQTLSHQRSSCITHWRCSLTKNHRYICKAKAKTKKFGSIEKVKLCGEHWHGPSYAK